MSVVVFAGPTIGRDAVAAILACDVRPPAGQGDVYRAALGRPRAIGLIDGYFHGVAAVWHKEILWAMAQGIHVFGASSMGALRAAELADFGMRGCGRIFADYRAGAITDDDEVAVLHAPAEMDYAPLSEAMVNIRATLAAAVDAGVLGSAAADRLCRAAKATFYQQRDWHVLLEAAPIGDAERAALEAWLPAGRVDLKRQDAVAMLEALRDFLAADPPPLAVGYTLEWTDLWDSVVAAAASAAAAPTNEAALVLDELRLDPERFRQVQRGALLRLLAAQSGAGADAAAERASLTRFRAARGLFSRDDLAAWQAANGLDDGGLAQLVAEEAVLEALAETQTPALPPLMLRELQASGGFEALRARALAKQAALARAAPVAGTPGLHPLARWYFETRLGRDVPSDLGRFAREIGLSGRDALARILMHELVYYSSRPGAADQSTREEPHSGISTE